jgi:hypothetical protein
MNLFGKSNGKLLLIDGNSVRNTNLKTDYAAVQVIFVVKEND